jgi:hypothetical protein
MFFTWILPLCANRETTSLSASAASSRLRRWAMLATSSSTARRPRTVRTRRCGGRRPLTVAHRGEGGGPAAPSSRSSSESEDGPLSLLTMLPTRQPGSESEAGASRGVAGPTASISRQRWMSEDARGPEGGGSTDAAAQEEEGGASEGAGEGSRNAAARAGAGRSSASPARRGAGAAHRSRIWRRGVGATSAGEEEEGGGCSCWCGGGVTRVLKNVRAAGVVSLHEADS